MLWKREWRCECLQCDGERCSDRRGDVNLIDVCIKGALSCVGVCVCVCDVWCVHILIHTGVPRIPVYTQTHKFPLKWLVWAGALLRVEKYWGVCPRGQLRLNCTVRGYPGDWHLLLVRSQSEVRLTCTVHAANPNTFLSMHNSFFEYFLI